MKYARYYYISCGFLLVFAGMAKLVSGTGRVHVLNVYDPLLRVPYRYLFLVAGGLELLVAFYCFFGSNVRLKALLVACLATTFVIYRIGLVAIHYQYPCPCLGTLTTALHVPTYKADLAMKVVLAYLAVGSYVTLLWLWVRQRKQSGSVFPDLAKSAE